MKKILFILIILICGCSKDINLNIDNIQSINYDTINLIENDFDLIKNEIKRLNFKKKNVEDISGKVLKIVTNNNIYNFNIFENNVYYKDTDIYVSSNKSLIKKLDEIKKNYTDTSFFDIKYDECKDNKSIKINNVKYCLYLESSQILYNFKINSITMTHDYLEETSLLYEKDELKGAQIIKVNILDKPNIKLSFTTKYNYNISVLPIYNKEENKLNLNLTSTQKK